MPIWTTGSLSSSKSIGQVTKTRVTTITLTANGLMPNSGYTFWCNGVDMTWACRTRGSRMGSGLVSDEFGTIIVLFSAELTPDFAASSQGSSKYNAMQLKNVSGEVHSIGISSQSLLGK